MSTTAIKLKKSSVSGKAPLVSDIDYGELALNYADGKLFYKHSGNTIRSFLDSNQILNLIDSDYLKNIINSTYIQVSRPINVVEDSAPFLGGNLNLNGRNITDSGSSGSITMSGNITGGNITATGDISGAYLRSTNSVGDEGGEITLAKPVTNTTIAGNGVTIDVYQNKLRIFEQGGTSRGAFIDLTAAVSGAGSNLLAGGSGSSYVTGKVILTTTSANQIVDSFAYSSVRTVKYYVEASTSSGYHATEILLTHDGSNCYITEYATIYSGSSLASFDANISGSNARLLVTPVNANTTITFARIDVLEGGAVGGGGYTLPTASTTVLGGVKVDGSSIVIDSDGIISSVGGSSSFSSEYSLTGTTTNATETEILVNGSTRIPVATNKSVNYIVNIAARRTDSAGDYAMFELQGIAANNNGTVTDIGSVYEVIIARTNAGYLVDARANDSNNSINIYVTGVTGHTISWKASAQIIEV